MQPPSPPERTFVQLLSGTRREIDARLDAFLAEERKAAAACGLDTEAVFRAIHDLTMRGGKRARPALVVAGYLATPGARRSQLEPSYSVGVALELLQSYLLIHDDWMDEDEVRRGGPAVHVLLRQHYNDARMGEINAILAGDYTCALAQKALFEGLQGHPHGLAVASAFARIQRDVVFGQILDVGGRAEDIERMHDLKTGSYTVQGPLELGALLAGATPATLEALRRFALPVGIAFQLCDDLLSAFGSEAITGKPRGNDLRAGKRTSVLAEALRLLSPQDLALLGRVQGNPGATPEQVEEVLQAFERCGARAAVEARRDVLLREAEGILEASALEERHLLRDAARALVIRSA